MSEIPVDVAYKEKKEEETGAKIAHSWLLDVSNAKEWYCSE